MRFQDPTAVLAPLCALAILFCACGESQVEGGPEAGAENNSPPRPTLSVERDEGQAARDLRRALDLGLVEGIAELFEAARGTLGVEAVLLEARLKAIEGDDLEVARKIERARAQAPDDARVYATAAELHAASGRLETAREEIRRGLDICGTSPELLRAQAFVQLSQQGGAQRGLDLLKRALRYDPNLPFTDRATGQAHLLLGKRALSERRTRSALEQAKLSLESDPVDFDARLFFADALAANGEFPSAVRVLEELESEGHERGGELALMYKRAALGELLLGRRDQSLEYFRLAREAGLDDEELGTGADILRTAALDAMKQGKEAFESDDLETARMRFEHALRLDDGLLVVHSQLAVVLLRQGEPLPAATHWRRVLDEAIEQDLELPDPVHIFLAKALFAAKELPAARAVLEAYLEREPEGQWREATSALLEQLP